MHLPHSMLGEFYAETMPYIDYHILETNAQVTHLNNRADFNFNLKTTVRLLGTKI